MKRQDVQSREYKVMLLPERFPGADEQAGDAAGAFWSDLAAALEPLGIPTEGRLDQVKAHRRIRFFDTAEHGLNDRRYVLRERVDVGSGEREITLKFRHPDRYVAQDRDMDCTTRQAAKTKFEEDVKPPFVSVFSYSTTAPLGPDRDLADLRNVAALFPGLMSALAGVDKHTGLAVVGDFTARELVLGGGSVLLGKRDIEAECALVVWHDDDDPATPPVVAEFSFKYGDDQEDYRGSVAQDAHDVLRLLHTDLPAWVHPEPRTKTVFVYG